MAEEDDLFAMFCDAVADAADEKPSEQKEAPKATYRPPMIIPAPAPVAVEHPLLPVRELAHSPELVLRAEAGDVDGVRQILGRGADPNTVHVDEQRCKGSDCCAGVLITHEERTPLISACMGKHIGVVEVLLEHDCLDVNIVCYGFFEDAGPYKYFTAMDMAAHAQDRELSERLAERGALPAEGLDKPPWPRPVLARREAAAAAFAPGAAARRPEAKVPAAAGITGSELLAATLAIVSTMQAKRHAALEERGRVLKQLLVEWHPDKRPAAEQELATAVFQWLNGDARSFAA